MKYNLKYLLGATLEIAGVSSLTLLVDSVMDFADAPKVVEGLYAAGSVFAYFAGNRLRDSALREEIRESIEDKNQKDN